MNVTSAGFAATGGWLMLPMLMLAACQSEPATRYVTKRVGQTMLMIAVPARLEAMSTRDGIALQLSDASERRSAYRMVLSLDGERRTPPTPLEQQRGSGSDAIRYRVALFDGGSGGEEITLIAARACAGRTLRLRFDAQAEDGVDLEPAFAMLESARCTRAA